MPNRNIERLYQLAEKLGEDWVRMHEEVIILAAKVEAFKAVILSSTDPIITADLNGIILTVNPATCALFGYNESEMLGKNITLVMPERYHAMHRSGLDVYRKTGVGPILDRAIDGHGLRKDGSEVPLKITVSGFQGAAGRWISASLKPVPNNAGDE